MHFWLDDNYRSIFICYLGCLATDVLTVIFQSFLESQSGTFSSKKMLSIKVSVWLILILTCGKVFSQEAEFKLCKDSGGLLITESLCKPVDYDKSR